jgi:hypothetical protein
MIGLAAGSLYLLSVAWKAMTRKERAVAVLAAVLAGAVVGGAMVKRFQGPDRFSLHRVGIWNGTVEMVQDHLWTGVGPGQFDWNAARYQFPDGEGLLSYDHRYSGSHSDWLRLPAEFGLPGTVLMILLLAGTVQAVRKRRRSGALPPWSAGPVAALLALLVQSAFQNLSHSPAVYLTAAALIGGLLGRGDLLPERLGLPCDGRGSPRPWRIAGTVVLLLVFLAADVGPYLAYRFTDGLGRKPGIADLERAVQWNRLQPHIRMSLAEAHMEGRPMTPDAYRSARTEGEEAVRLHTGSAELRKRLARIEARGCRELFRDRASRERALRHFLAAEARAPYDAVIPLETGDFLFSVSDPAGAVAAADRALRLEPGSIPPRLLKAVSLLARDGGAAVPEAERLLKESETIGTAGTGAGFESEYTRVMLAVDPERLAAVEEALDKASRSDSN